MTLPSIGLISHGTSSAEGRTVIEALAAAVTEDLLSRGLAEEVMLGHVDVQHSDVAEVLSTLPHDAPVILVPLLFSPGYHVHVDLAEAVRDARNAVGPDARRISESRDILAPPLLHDGAGAPSLLVDIVRHRIISAL